MTSKIDRDENLFLVNIEFIALIAIIYTVTQVENFRGQVVLF